METLRNEHLIATLWNEYSIFQNFSSVLFQNMSKSEFRGFHAGHYEPTIEAVRSDEKLRTVSHFFGTFCQCLRSTLHPWDDILPIFGLESISLSFFLKPKTVRSDEKLRTVSHFLAVFANVSDLPFILGRISYPFSGSNPFLYRSFSNPKQSDPMKKLGPSLIFWHFLPMSLIYSSPFEWYFTHFGVRIHFFIVLSRP